MDETNALPENTLTIERSEEDTQATDSPTEGETSPDKGAEPPDGAKNWQHALQRERERYKAEREKAAQLESRLQEVTGRLDEMELSGLDDTERYRLEAEKARAEADTLRQQIEVENIKKEYRAYLAEKERDFPKTVTFLRRQAERDIYPVQGQDRDQFDMNFEDFAKDYEGVPQTGVRPPTANPAYQPPAEIDYSKLSAEELKRILPRTEKE